MLKIIIAIAAVVLSAEVVAISFAPGAEIAVTTPAPEQALKVTASMFAPSRQCAKWNLRRLPPRRFVKLGLPETPRATSRNAG